MDSPGESSSFPESLRRVRSTGDITHRLGRPSQAHRRSEGGEGVRFEHVPRAGGHRGAFDGLPMEVVAEDVGREGAAGTTGATVPPPSRTSTGVGTTSDRGASQGLIRKILLFLGYGPNNEARKEFVSLIWNVTFQFSQMVVTLTLVIISTKAISPTKSPLNEWHACDTPLGVWNTLWFVRATIGVFMTGWGWCRDRRIRQLGDRPNQNDVETNTRNPPNPDPMMDDDDLFSSLTPPPSRMQSRTESSPTAPPSRRRRRQQQRLPHAALHGRVSFLCSLFSVAWFLIGHIFVYTSIHSCRFSAPHLWWLAFGILCILYLVIAEVLLIAIIVFIIGPLAFLFWNIFLVCLGRHPLQNPHYINPDIGKIPKTLVDNIPLVLYIPTPPDGFIEKHVVSRPAPIYSPSSAAAHAYPPKPAQPSQPKPRFRFLRLKSKKSAEKEGGKSAGASGGDSKDVSEKGKTVPPEERAWEDNWEKSEYPFVRLENNRAACAICLMDFEAPKQAPGAVLVPQTKAEEAGEQSNDTSDTMDNKPLDIEEVVPSSNEANQPDLHLLDAGEGAQPLRLLECGHVFHKTCLDPWLTDVSGRCPTCQRPVVVKPINGKKRRR